MNKAIEVLEIPEEIADDLTNLHRLLATSSKVLTALSIVPSPVGPFVGRTKTVVDKLTTGVGKAKTVAVKFDRGVAKIRKPLRKTNEVVAKAAGHLAQFQGAVRDSRKVLDRVNRCLTSKRLDKSVLDAFSAGMLPIVEGLDQAFIEANNLVQQADDAVDRVGAKCQELIPIEKAIDEVTDALGKLNVILDPIEDALSHKISITYGVKVKVKGKWYQPWKWKIKTRYKKFKFTVNQILRGVDAGIGAVNDLLMKAAKKLLKPLLGKVNLDFKLPGIPGLDKLGAKLDDITSLLNQYTNLTSQINRMFDSQLKAIARFQQQMKLLNGLDLGECRPS